MANSTFNLSTINGTNGFAINGIDSGDGLGYSVSSAGDINGDGFDDLSIGKYDPNPFFPFLLDYLSIKPSQSYVVFGSKGGFSAQLNVSTLNGTNGFVINAINPGDFLGSSVSSAGDINGDGLDDLILGAFRANGESGQSYVVFGSKSGFDAQLNVSNLNGTNGFAINGTNNNLSDQLGGSVSSAGDINSDGIDDLIIGAIRAPNGNRSGQSYVVFGSKSSFDASFDIPTLNGTNGFAINGIDSGDFSGGSVSSAGDVNGDGLDDLILGAFRASSNDNRSSGQSYVVFGSKSGFDASFDLSTLNGTSGFAINGINVDDNSGFSVSNAGDVNGDGLDDLIIGTRDASESYVVFGSKGGFDASFDLSTLNGTNGFTINGIGAYDRSGSSVSNAGDVNGDGLDDLIIGARNASESYVVFGSKGGFDASFDLSTLNGTNGFAINGNDRSGFSVSNAGDVNGDGFDDLIIGAPSAAANGISESGQSYVVFGGKNIGSGSTINLTGTASADTLIGTIGNNIIDGKAGKDTLTGNGG
ncbi:FG-GAP repeat protein [Nostoc flagelliforme FACHB-838]|uniref:FG-GAP repeat protein n=2 Tax=Nostoc flagelliforme TaxID=1306274 RepID=A0ABR8E1X5_9NOSO|nr:FG-GAP repeat protein [Nostoc flagelliforme FACHB-838]